MTQFLIKRGLKSDLPVLSEGEMAFCTDTKEYFIGSSTGNIKLANFSDIGGGNFETLKTIYVGELFAPPGNYNAWTPNAVVFDSKRNKFVGIINAADAHVFTVVPHYFYTIDPETLISTNPVKIVPKDALGNNAVFATESAASAFTILNDGSYIYFRKGADTLTYNLIQSTDGGTTWLDKGPINVNPAWTAAYTFWAVFKLSTGRLIASLGGTSITKGKIMYSDDNGLNWVPITIGGSIIAGSVTAAEPAIIEVGNNKLISIARKSTSGLTYGTTGGAPDPALIAFSTDNGITWTQYKDSTTILDMNASDAAACVHDGIVEVFVASRFYTTTSNVNTGKTGALYHYTATIDNALQDKFTLKEVILYANALDSVNFSSPCVSLDNKNRMLLTYMDESNYPQADVNYFYVRGGIGFSPYTSVDKSSSPVYSHSGKYIDSVISSLKSDLASLQYAVSKAGTSGVNIPVDTLTWTKIYNAKSKQIKLCDDTNFTGISNFINTAAGYSDLLVDANGITYYRQNSSFAIASQTTKNNFAVYYKGTLGNQSHCPIAAVIINGVGYGIWEPGDLGISDSNTVVHEYRFEYWNGTMKGYIDGVDTRVVSFTIDSTNVLYYTQLMNIIGTLDNTKKYLITGGAGNNSGIYDLRLGEWS